MKAIIYTKYGAPEVLQLIDIDKPVPKNNEVLIRVYATTVTAADCMMRTGEPKWGRVILGIGKPKRKVLGLEYSGIIESTGKNVSRFKVGDEVFGFTGFKLGAHAEYLCVPENKSIDFKPDNLNHNQAASIVDGSTTSYFFLKKLINIKKEDKVLIIGASGSIGTAAVQIANFIGAEVTGVCSTKNIELVKTLGSDKVIDYTKEDFTKASAKYDIIFDTVGKSSFSKCKRSLNKNGYYLPTTGLINNWFMLWTSIKGGKKVKTGMSVNKNEALLFIKNLIENEQLKPVIDKTFTLENIEDAHRYVDTGHKKGNVVITV